MSSAVRCDRVLVAGEPLHDTRDDSVRDPRDTVEDVGVPTGVELPAGFCIAGKYTIHGVLGHGGVAVVYDAEHTGLARRVAIKVLHVDENTPPALFERFRREVRISALVHHPNVLGVYDSGALPDGSPFLVMERLNGENLASLIARGPLPVPLVVEIGCQLLRAVAAVSEAGIVHRDIKPANVMLHDPVDGPRCVKLLDFGISKRMGGNAEQQRLTCHGTLVGTPQYMAPEQICGDQLDVRTDLYAVGTVLYEALTAHAPHESDNFSELLVSVLSAPVPPIRSHVSHCPPALERIILRALSQAPQNRYESAEAFLAELEQFAIGASLPRGAAAFLASVLESSADQTAEARPTVLRPRRRRGRFRPLQLGAMAVVLGAQAAALHLYGAPWFEPAERALAQRGASQVAAQVSEPAMREERAAPLAELPAQSEVGAVVPTDASFKALPVSSLPLASEPTSRRRGARAREEDADAADRSEAARSEADAAAPDAQAFKRTMDAALAALVRGELAQASVHYAEAARLGPNEPSALRGLGLVSARLGDRERAREALVRYLELAPAAKDAAAIRSRIEALTP